MFLYEPINTLRPVEDDLWIVEGPVVRMAAYGFSIPFPTRMTVVRLQSGDLFLHSPIKPSEGLRRELEAIGRIRHLVSPNKIHYANIGAWKSLYPDALAWASPGVRERAASQKIEVWFDRNLGPAPEPEWAQEVDQLVFRGSRFMEEIVFFHRKTRTLLVADLIENFERERLGFFSALLARVGGVLDPHGSMPRDLRMTYLGRHHLARESLLRILDWHPDKLILGHGRWFERDGESELRRAFSWLRLDAHGQESAPAEE